MTCSLRLGINDCFAVKRWPLAADWGPLVRDRLGLRLVQHSFDLVDMAIDDGAALRSSVAGLGLELHSTFTGLAAYSANLLMHPDPGARDAAEAWYRAAIDWTARAGGLATGGHVGAMSVRDWSDPVVRKARWANLGDALGRLAGGARHAGLDHLLVENLAASREPSTMDMIRDLVTDGDATAVPIRLCLDVGHMCVPGTSGNDRDPYAWLRRLGASATVIQLQQSDPDGDHHWPFTPERNALGRIDPDRVIEALGESGVERSLLILEVIPPFEQADDDVVDDLVASATCWLEALDHRGVLEI